MYHVPWIALISAKRWRLYVLTFLIHGFTRNDFRLSEQWVFYFWKCFHDCNLVMSCQITIFFLLSIRHQFFLVCKVTLLIYEKVSFAYQLFSCAQCCQMEKKGCPYNSIEVRQIVILDLQNNGYSIFGIVMSDCR